MEGVTEKVQKASTHAGSVGVDIAAVERDCAYVDGSDVDGSDVDATSQLPNNKRERGVTSNGALLGWFHGVNLLPASTQGSHT